MKAAFKFITTAIGLILIALSLVALAFMGPLSHFIAGLVARDLAAIYGAEVTLADCKVRPFQQRIELQGLTIHNPPPFRAGPALVVERVDIDLDTAAFVSGEPTARRALYAGLTVHVRHQSGEGTNLGRLARNADAFAAEQRAKTPEGEVPRGLRVEVLRAEGAILRLSSDALSIIEVTVPIEAVEVEGVAERGPLVRGELTPLLIRTLLLEATGAPGLLEPIARALRLEALETPEPRETPAPR